MARTNWPGSFGHSLIGDDCRAGFVWSERNRELAGKRQVRFIVLRVPADFRVSAPCSCCRSGGLLRIVARCVLSPSVRLTRGFECPTPAVTA